MNVSESTECDGCGRDQSAEHFRCAVCRGLFCEDCTNHPADDEGPCVECEAKAPRVETVAHAPMDNGAVHIRWRHEDASPESLAEFHRAVAAWMR